MALRFSYQVKCKQLATFNFLVAVKHSLTPRFATPRQLQWACPLRVWRDHEQTIPGRGEPAGSLGEHTWAVRFSREPPCRRFSQLPVWQFIKQLSFFYVWNSFFKNKKKSLTKRPPASAPHVSVPRRVLPHALPPHPQPVSSALLTSHLDEAFFWGITHPHWFFVHQSSPPDKTRNCYLLSPVLRTQTLCGQGHACSVHRGITSAYSTI